MPEASPSGPSGSPTDSEHREMLERVEVTHRDLRTLIEQLVSASDVESIASGLCDLPTILAEHFAEEEAPGGLYDGLRHRRPDVETELTQLRGDHVTLAGQVEALVAKADAGGSGAAKAVDFESLRAGTRAFADLLRGHERVESRLVSEIYYAEDGSSG